MNLAETLGTRSGRAQSLISKLDSDEVAMDYKALLRAEKAAYLAEKKAKENSTAATVSTEVDGAHHHPRAALNAALEKSPSAIDISPLDIEVPVVPDVDLFKIGNVPDMYYFPHVCNHSDGEKIRSAILHNSDDTAKASSHSMPEATLQTYKDYIERKVAEPDLWLQVRNRQLQCWGKQVENETAGGAHEGEELPSFLSDLGDRLVESILSKISPPVNENLRFDHVLINKYPPTGGILHHTDGPRYKPFVAILSLGGPTVMSFRAKLASDEIGVKSNEDLFSVVLQPNSLLVFTKRMYENYLHGIVPGKNRDVVGSSGEFINLHLLDNEDFRIGKEILRGDRISLTFRNVSATI